MDKKRGLLNVSVSITFKIIILIGGIAVRRFLIDYVGNEVNGLNSLYLSIIGFLAVAELGVGSAITFCMYKPIVEGENDKVSALYFLFKKLYLIIGIIILAAGIGVMPFLPYLAKDYAELEVNLYITFALMLLSVVITYFFSAKVSLINAYKNDYITTTVNSLMLVLQYVLQITVLIFTRSYVWYLVCRIVVAFIQWVILDIITQRKYPIILKNKVKLDIETATRVRKTVKAMFMHKIGGVLVNAVDSVVISAFIGVVILGKYSNYMTIMSSMIGVLDLCFIPLVSVIGHTCVEESKENVIRYFRFFHAFNFALGVIFFLGYFAVIDSVVIICFGVDLVMDWTIPFIITLNYFIQFMRRSALLFRDSTGTFYNDRYKPLFEGLTNLVLSILFVQWFGVVGVIVATIITDMFICHIVEPHVLYKYAFGTKAKNYYLINYGYMVIFAALLVLMYFIRLSFDSAWLTLLVNGVIAVAVALVPCGALVLLNPEFKVFIKNQVAKLKKIIFKKKRNV